MISLATRWLFAVALGCLAVPAAAVDYKLGTATKGGGFEVYGAALAEVVNAQNGAVRLIAVATKGSGENLALLRAGKIDVALVEGNAALKAFGSQVKGRDELAVLWVMYPSPGSFIVRADTPFKSISDLKGRRIAWGTSSSGLRLLAATTMSGLGLDVAEDFKPVILKSAGEGVRLVLDGEVDALWGGGIGWPPFAKIAKGPKGGRFITPDEKEIAQILARHPSYSRMTVAANIYPGQNEPLVSVGLWSVMMVRRDMPDPSVRAIAGALAAAEKGLQKRAPQTAYSTAANTASHVKPAALLHGGVAAVLKSRGLLP